MFIGRSRRPTSRGRTWATRRRSRSKTGSAISWSGSSPVRFRRPQLLQLDDDLRAVEEVAVLAGLPGLEDDLGGRLDLLVEARVFAGLHLDRLGKIDQRLVEVEDDLLGPRSRDLDHLLLLVSLVVLVLLRLLLLPDRGADFGRLVLELGHADPVGLRAIVGQREE